MGQCGSYHFCQADGALQLPLEPEHTSKILPVRNRGMAALNPGAFKVGSTSVHNQACMQQKYDAIPGLLPRPPLSSIPFPQRLPVTDATATRSGLPRVALMRAVNWLGMTLSRLS